MGALWNVQNMVLGALSSGQADGFWPNLHNTLLGGREELIKCWWPWPNFQGHSSTSKCPKYVFLALSSELVDEFWPNLHRYIVRKKERVAWILVTLTFSKSQWHFEMPKIWYCAWSEPVDGFWPNSPYTHCWEEREGLTRFWWLWPKFQGHRHFEMSNFDQNVFVYLSFNWTLYSS